MSNVPNREVPVRIVYRYKKHHAGSHGGAWKVAFADFMTAMFALFLVLWLVNQSSDIKSAIAGYFQDPLGRADEFGSSIMPGDGAHASMPHPINKPDVFDLRRDQLSQFAEYLKSKLEDVPELESVKDDIEIDLTEDGLRIQLLEDSTGVFFQSGKAIPSTRGHDILALLGHELKSLPNRVQIEGYTDARPYSGLRNYSNWELSADRANMARRILTDSGLPDTRIAQIRGYADRELRDPKDPFSARNRRITITMLLGPRMAGADSTHAGANAKRAAGDSTTHGTDAAAEPAAPDSTATATAAEPGGQP